MPMTQLQPTIQSTKTTCPYCGVGCGVVVRTQGGKIIDVKGDETHPANWGKLCSKGSKLAETATVNVYGQVRASQPLLRIQRDQQVAPTNWDTALDFTAREFARLIS
ncbi:MAG: nitrate reductase, partial [Limnobacter sp.]